MELNWSTFLLEIINFLILVWILKRFLYRPVLNILEQRRAAIELKMSEGEKLHANALALQKKYQLRLEDWAIEKQHAWESLQQEIQTEKTRKLEQLQQELANEREKANVVDARQKAETLKGYQQKAHAQGAKFASKLLTAVAGPELEARLVEISIQSLNKLDEQQLTTFQETCKISSHSITVTSAYPLANTQQHELEQKLSVICKQSVHVTYRQEPALIAGLELCIGAWILRLNLQDEFRQFAELSHDTSIN